MASILLVVKGELERQQFARQQMRIAFETSAEPAAAVKGATAGGDERKLRGIPAIGRGVTGAIAGTVPHSVR
ncbi:MAG TPA: hypothetical protein VN085_11370 [Vicinamibacterales bacterium]|nr:hypothetical protein [Vicinamibacterales bacterium]